ncbi:hypothetical protein Tco_1173779 [Tanacetum coccineum]
MCHFKLRYMSFQHIVVVFHYILQTPAEEQPLPAALSPTIDSPGYIVDSDPKEDPEEDSTDYPADGGDDEDDKDESSDDDEDDNDDVEEDEDDEEKKEHLAPTDSTAIAFSVVDHAPSAEETKPFETDESATTPPPHPAYRVTARISIRPQIPVSLPSDTEIARLFAIPTPPPSPLSTWSSPLPHIPSPPLPPILSPLPVSSLPPLPLAPPPLHVSPTYLLGYRAAMIQLRAEAPSTSHSPLPHIILSHTRADTPPSGTLPSGTPPLLPIPLPTSSPPLHLLSTDRRADRPEVTLPPRKRLGIALSLRYEVGESSSAPTARPPGGFRVDYGFVATMDREITQDLERDVGYGITDTWNEMLTERHLMAGRLNMLYRDRRAYARTSLLMERKARVSQEAWGLSMDASDLARSEVMSLRTTVLGQRAVITELQVANRRR